MSWEVIMRPADVRACMPSGTSLPCVTDLAERLLVLQMGVCQALLQLLHEGSGTRRVNLYHQH